jgi:AcrR family transcriptional regulator
MAEVKDRKPYRSPRRAEQLDATRRHILQVARKLFGERGYAGTTMEAIAGESGLAVPTVYKNFGNKRRLLLALIDQTINVRVPPKQDAVAAKPEPRARLHALAQMCVDLASGAADVVSILVSAAGSDPEFKSMSEKMAEGRRRNAGLLAHSLARDDALRPGCTEAEARDVMYALAGPELYELLVTGSGWSDEQFESWLSDALAALLLREAHRSQPLNHEEGR